MAVGDLVFGNHTSMFQVPAPASMQVTRSGYFESMSFENGGGVVARSKPFQQSVEMVYPWFEASGGLTVDRLQEYASGEYGDEILWLTNPMAYDRNCFPRAWASPGLYEQGWPNVGHSVPVMSATAANTFFQPPRKPTYTITTAANATPLTDATIPYVILPIATGYTMWLGATGAATGTAGVRFEAWVPGAGSAFSSNFMTLQSETGSTRLAHQVVSTDASFVKVFLTRTSAAASTITPISLMAQLYVTGVTPTLTGLHVRGQGFHGLRFAGNFGETWTDASSGRHYKSASIPLIETGGWE